jgi:DNA-binding MarR family transcriptional regulator
VDGRAGCHPPVWRLVELTSSAIRGKLAVADAHRNVMPTTRNDRSKRTPPGRALADELVTAVRRANIAFDASASAGQSRLGVSRTELAALEWLSVSAPMLVGDLAGELAISSGTASEAVDRLGSKGLVKKQPDEQDRRRTRVSITARGRRQFRSSFHERWRWLHATASEMPPDDVRCVIRFLQRLHDIMPESWRLDAPSPPPEVSIDS